MKRSVTPHDYYFRAAMIRPEVHKPFFEAHLPPAIRKQVDLNTFKLCKESFIDIALWQQLTGIGGTNPEDYIVESSHYLLNAAEISDKKAFIEMIQQNLIPNIGERVMTIGQLFKEEGRQEGRQEGHIEAQKGIARNMLENGMGIEMVSRLTKLPISVIQAIEKELKQAQH
jgi:predicted transposase YdaD